MALSHLSDSELLSKTETLLGSRRQLTADLLEYLAEMEARGLHLKEAYSSMFDFCVRKLRLSEGSAVRHLAAARVCGRLPLVLEWVRDGRIHLTGLEFLSKYLTSENHLDLLAAAANKSKAEIEVTLRAWFPRPDVPERVRPVTEQPGLAVVAANAESAGLRASELELAAPSAASGEASRAERGRVAPLSADRFHVEFTVSAQSRDKLERALDLMSHQNPRRSVAVAFDRALDALLRDLEKKKLGKTSRPRKSRGAKFGDISRATRREVYERDGEQCSYVSEAGLRCTARAFVELDHANARALGGSGEPENARVLCRAHNQFEARRVFGEEHVARCIRRKQERHRAPGNVEADECNECVDGGIHLRQRRSIHAAPCAARRESDTARRARTSIAVDGAEHSGSTSVPGEDATSAPSLSPEKREKLFCALTKLGFGRLETRNALAKFERRHSAELGAPIETLLRDALALLTT